MLPPAHSQFHFAYPLWLLGGIAIPLVWLLYFLFFRKQHPLHRLKRFIDPHLLPYLLLNSSSKKHSFWKGLIIWSVVWSCLTLALAGPRWSYREMETYSRDQSLVILLDLSESMNATDIKPSRLIQAKQKIEDLLNLSQGVKIGLIAFAADPHMITPLTEDKETIRHLLPMLGTDLVFVQGSRLSSALEMGSRLFEAEPGNNKALLVISDGGFEDSSAMTTAQSLAEKGIVIHVMGIGTIKGAPLQDHDGTIIKKKGIAILSKLEREKLQEVSKFGKGNYYEAHHRQHEEEAILRDLATRADAQIDISKTSRQWDEHFYLLILPALPFLLWWFRRGALLTVFFLCFSFSLQANYFKNSEQQGKQFLEEGDFKAAAEAFQDPYRKGVASYKARDFADAEKYFRQSTREEVAPEAAYNLANSLVQQEKLKEAVTAYEEVLKKWPDRTKAKENLELVKKLLEEQNQDQQKSDQSDSDKDQDQKESDKKDSDHKDKDDSQNSDQKDSQQPQNQDKEEDENSQPSNDEDKQASDTPETSQDQSNEQRGSEEKQEDPSKTEEQKEALSEKEAKEIPAQSQEITASKSQEDQDADLWLNKIGHDPKNFLKNKFFIESKKCGTKKGSDPW